MTSTATGFCSQPAGVGGGLPVAAQRACRARTGLAAGDSSTSATLDAEATHAVAQRVAADAEQPCRAHDVAAGARQCAADARRFVGVIVCAAG